MVENREDDCPKLELRCEVWPELDDFEPPDELLPNDFPPKLNLWAWLDSAPTDRTAVIANVVMIVFSRADFIAFPLVLRGEGAEFATPLSIQAFRGRHCYDHSGLFLINPVWMWLGESSRSLLRLRIEPAMMARTGMRYHR